MEFQKKIKGFLAASSHLALRRFLMPIVRWPEFYWLVGEPEWRFTNSSSDYMFVFLDPCENILLAVVGIHMEYLKIWRFREAKNIITTVAST